MSLIKGTYPELWCSLSGQFDVSVLPMPFLPINHCDRVLPVLTMNPKFEEACDRGHDSIITYFVMFHNQHRRYLNNSNGHAAVIHRGTEWCTSSTYNSRERVQHNMLSKWNNYAKNLAGMKALVTSKACRNQNWVLRQTGILPQNVNYQGNILQLVDITSLSLQGWLCMRTLFREIMND